MARGSTVPCAFTAPRVPDMPLRAAALLVALLAPATAAAELPRDLAAPIWYAAQSGSAGDPRGVEGELAVAVVNALTLRPDLADEIMAVSAAAAPPAMRAGLAERIALARPAAAGTDADAASPPLESRLAVSSPGTIQPSTPPLVPQAPPAPARGAAEDGVDIGDPLEDVNRVVFWVNDMVDTLVLRPVAWTYGEIAPAFVKRAFGNFFRNLDSPVVLANDLLQLELEDAATTTGRFLVNSTLGVLGLFEVGEDFGMPPHPADFGQTLHAYGVGFGPYIVLPLLGPSSARDATGVVADSLMNPLTYLLDRTTRVALAASEAVVQREPLIAPLDDLKANSLDYYVALRSSWYQNRQASLRRGPAGSDAGTAGQDATDALFDAAE